MKLPEIKRFFKKIRRIPRNISQKLRNLLDDEDKEFLKEYTLGLVLYGLMANFVFTIFLGFEFTWYSWLAYGFTINIIENKVIKWFRRLWFK